MSVCGASTQKFYFEKPDPRLNVSKGETTKPLASSLLLIVISGVTQPPLISLMPAKWIWITVFNVDFVNFTALSGLEMAL